MAAGFCRSAVPTARRPRPPGPVPAGGGKITLGFLLPSSGEMSNVGFRVQWGTDAAARQAMVELVFKDTQNDPGGRGRNWCRSWRRTPRCWPSWGPSPR